MSTSNKPVTGRPETYLEMMFIVQHPAFRIGFLDAAAGHQLNHDKIIERIFSETPKGALKRLGWLSQSALPNLFLDDEEPSDRSVRVAQYRYEEGRLLHLEYGVTCKACGHPDYPPVGVEAFCHKRACEVRNTREVM